MSESKQASPVMRIFDVIAKTYDHQGSPWFDHTASAICKAGELRAGQRALDLATGTGKVALRLAAAAPEATVVGFDLSTGMLAEAERKADTAGLRNVSFQQGSFEAMNFGTRFDLVTCSFGLFFVEDMVGALQQFAAQVAPGGRLILSSFSVGAFSPFTDCFARLYEEFGYERSTPKRMRLSSADLIHQLFKDAGLGSPSCTLHDFNSEITSADAWWKVLWNTVLREMLEAMGATQLKSFREQHLAEVQSLIDRGTTRLNLEVVITSYEPAA